MNVEILTKLGLTGNEAKIYLALLELGSTAAGPLIKKVGMHRAAVYNLLDLLIDKGLVHYVKKAERKYFEAHDPERLLEFLEEKKQELNKQEQELKDILPELQLKRKLVQDSQEGTIYKGKKGLKSIFEDVLKENQPFYVFGATGKFKEILSAYFIHWHHRRAKLKIPLKIIYNESVRKERRAEELRLAQIKYLSQPYTAPSTTLVYGEKVVIVNWSAEPLAFLIRSKEVANSYHLFFKMMWDNSKS